MAIEPTAQRPARAPAAFAWPQIIGLLCLAVGVAAGMAMELSAARPLWCAPLGVVASIIGAWLLPASLGPTITIAAASLGFIAAGLGMGLASPGLAWPGLGIVAGCAARWGYERGKRPLWFVAAVAAIIYLAAAVGALVQCAHGRGIIWILAQGGGSLLAAWLCARATHRGSAERPDVARVLRVAARALSIAGLALPYAALVVMALRRIS